MHIISSSRIWVPFMVQRSAVSLSSSISSPYPAKSFRNMFTSWVHRCPYSSNVVFRKLLCFPQNEERSSRNKSSSSHLTGKMVRLTSRSVLSVSGKDSASFLQGLITNDIHLLDVSESGGPRSIYSLMLNVQGRVIYDLIIYKQKPEFYLIDHDSTLRRNLLQHLKMYKLRKQIQLEDLSEKFYVFALFSEGKKTYDATIFDGKNGFIHFHDPRLKLLGGRLFVDISANSSWMEFAKRFSYGEQEFRRFRYKLGVAEGSKDLPFGECFPLESNLDYLSGIHLQKGCYLGQELTARTFHTGVVRKRIMPVILEDFDNNSVNDNSADNVEAGASVISDQAHKSVGKFRSHVGKNGIAVLRISEALAAEKLTVNSSNGKTLKLRVVKPDWWPDPS